MSVGPNVRRVGYVDHMSDVNIRLSEQPDGQWAAVASSGRWGTNHIELGADQEAAAAALLGWLEDLGEWVPEPPADWWEHV